MKFFKNLFWLAVMAVSVVLVSCDKEDDGPSTPFSIIEATVVNGETYNSKIDVAKVSLNATEIASGKYEKGGFKITLPETLPAQYLKNLTDGAPQGIKISDTNAKIAVFETIGAYKDGQRVGTFEYYSTSVQAWFMYADRDANVTGSETKNSDDWKNIETYNMSLKKGWNTIYSKSTESESTKTYTTEVTTKAPSELKWYFDEDESESSYSQAKMAKSNNKTISLFK
jgi:hypothetical protein